MRGKWLQWLKRAHLFLGVFFSPLLLLFLITGYWQTFVSSDDRTQGYFNSVMSKFSTIHTDDYYPRAGGSHHSSEAVKFMIAAMAIAMGLSIFLGLMLAVQVTKRRWLVALYFLLGIIIPAFLIYFFS